MKVILQLTSLLTCVAIAFGVSVMGITELAGGDKVIDIMSDYSFDELDGADDLPRFRNKTQFESLIRTAYYRAGSLWQGGWYAKGEAVADGMMNSSSDAAAPEAAPQAPDTSAGNSPEELTDVSSTNVQTEGVDEGDIIKTDGRYIYIISGRSFRMFDTDGKQYVLSHTFTDGKLYGYIDSLYVKDNTVILIGSYTEYYDKAGEPVTEEKDKATEFGRPVGGEPVYDTDIMYKPGYGDYIYGYNSKTFACAEILDISDPTAVKVNRTVAYEGSLISSRETGGRLFMAVNKSFGYFYNGYPVYDDIVPGLYDSANDNLSVKPGDIVRAPGELQTNIMTLASIEYNSQEPAETLEILGWGSNIYMTAENLYIFGNEYSPLSGSCTTVVKYSVVNGIKYAANAKVRGNLTTEFSYNEYNGFFRMATTVNPSYLGSDGYRVNTNSVYKLDGELKVIGKLDGIAPDESIKSARFMGDTLYLVTFRQTDPLFCIDMSGETPVMKGELKVPGFSTYLHEVRDGLLLGIGYSTTEHTETYGDGYTSTWTTTDGVKVSLFDVSDLTVPTEADVYEKLGGEYSYSEAQNNYHAFTWSESASTAYIPISFGNSGNGYSNSGYGYAAIRITEDAKLDIQLVNAENTAGYGYTYGGMRLCFIGNELYLYTGSSLVLFDRAENLYKADYPLSFAE